MRLTTKRSLYLGWLLIKPMQNRRFQISNGTYVRTIPVLHGKRSFIDTESHLDTVIVEYSFISDKTVDVTSHAACGVRYLNAWYRIRLPVMEYAAAK